LTLIHDGRPLHESGTICEYLDDPGGSAAADTPERADVELDPASMALFTTSSFSTGGTTFEGGVAMDRRGTGREAAYSEQGTSGILAAGGASPPRRNDAARAKLVLLERWKTLKPSGWLVGKAYSIADISAVPFVKRIDEEIAPHEVTAKKHPCVADWWTKMPRAFARAGPFLARS
jgi:glutathione S-transferase